MMTKKEIIYQYILKKPNCTINKIAMALKMPAKTIGYLTKELRDVGALNVVSTQGEKAYRFSANPYQFPKVEETEEVGEEKAKIPPRTFEDEMADRKAAVEQFGKLPIVY